MKFQLVSCLILFVSLPLIPRFSPNFETPTHQIPQIKLQQLYHGSNRKFIFSPYFFKHSAKQTNLQPNLQKLCDFKYRETNWIIGSHGFRSKFEQVLHIRDETNVLECGLITSNGVGALFDCKAMEDLLLRHDGCGIWRNFIIQAASKLPMLRSLSLDWCDAREGDLDLPNFTDRYSLSNVKISRCKLRKCSLDFHNIKAQKRAVHKETLVLLWNSRSLRRTVVKERIT